MRNVIYIYTRMYVFNCTNKFELEIKRLFFFHNPSFSQFRISKLIRKKDYLPTGRAKKKKKKRSILPRIYGVAQLDGLKARKGG